MIVGWLAITAHAQVEVCAGSWTVADWTEALDAVDAALAELDGDLALAIVGDVVEEARCTGEPIPRETLGRLARQSALIAFHAQDQPELQAWGLLARDVLDGRPWPDDLPAPARFHALLAELPPPRRAEVEGRSLAPPRGGAVLVDGEIVLTPVASVLSEHLVQVMDKKGRPVATAFTVGASFPPEALAEEGTEPEELSVPRWYEGPPPATVEGTAPEPDVEIPLLHFEPDPADLAPRVTFDGRAGVCPWDPDPEAVKVRSKRIEIDGREWSLRTEQERREFRNVLRACEEFKAARRFTQWSAKRGTMLAGAKHDRDAMVAALLAPEPKKKKPVKQNP
ncbi:MAG: hypothetical protein H6738_18270 [Alphaproteobacteria bacterium]|nr:hypothetical protein [Alphaproteobacteria bacterium]